MRSVPLHLHTNEDLITSLENFSKKYNSSGFILGVVGNLSKASIQCPGVNSPTVLEGNLEVITLNGTISPNGVHLHLSISDNSCKVWGGHLERGSIVLKGVDLLVGLLNDEPLKPDSHDIKQSNIEEDSKIKIFILNGCPWSSRAIRLLNNYNFKYYKKLITTDEDYNNVYSLSQSKTFPQIFIDNKYIGGFDQLSELHKKGELQKLSKI